MTTPTAEPAVPGAFGAKPAPRAVANAMASQFVLPIASVFVFTISIGSVDFCGWFFVCGNAVFSTGPSAEIDQLATLTAKRAKGIPLMLDFLFAGWAFHTIFPMRSYSKLSVISTL